ncbi:hypothetical protein QE357_001971 [Siphonobacter sp. BAB-5404]|nr:hypothetical protein [Siphonobacter sp. SORGH_AS_0500]
MASWRLGRSLLALNHSTALLMKRFCLLILLLSILNACKSDEPEIATLDPILPIELDEWVVLTAPQNGPVDAVFGNIDSTLIISQANQLYRTVDKGKTWKATRYKSHASIYGFSASGDTLNAYSSLLKIQDNPELYIASPKYYSLDNGNTWHERTIDEYFNRPHAGLKKAITAANGITYKIVEQQKTNLPPTSAPYVEKVGLQTSDGRLIYLPEEIGVLGISLDSQQRVYLACSAALCKGQYCNSRRGQIYISKKALP